MPSLTRVCFAKPPCDARRTGVRVITTSHPRSGFPCKMIVLSPPPRPCASATVRSLLPGDDHHASGCVPGSGSDRCSHAGYHDEPARVTGSSRAQSRRPGSNRRFRFTRTALYQLSNAGEMVLKMLSPRLVRSDDSMASCAHPSWPSDDVRTALHPDNQSSTIRNILIIRVL